MARVFQMVITNKNEPFFERETVDGSFHVEISYAGPRTLCGIQLDGDDGIAAGPEIQGRVTCFGCLSIISEIKKLRKWR